MATTPRYAVAIIGGATAGAEIAARLAEHGVEVTVFEQNPRPYGKIQDGLPRWHSALRRKEYETIAKKLGQPAVHFVPNTKIGADIDFAELANDWGFTGVVLATGAWHDRPLPVEGADDYIGRGLVYQNPFIIWFNHANEAGYDGPSFEPVDGALVVGGGLASIDVAKALMLENTRIALAKRGIEVDVVELEVKGIPKTLAAHDLSASDLGLEGCTLCYRRRAEDMPVVEVPEGASEERRAKIIAARGRLLGKAMEKYGFEFEPLAAPEGLIVEDGQLVGLRFRRTRIENGRVVATDETFERRGRCVYSSIGSIPEPMPGIPMKGELYDFVDWDLGRLADYPNVFSVGNIVTGKGNIVASRKHARAVAVEVIERFLGLGDGGHEGEEALLDGAGDGAAAAADAIAAQLQRQPPIDAGALESIHKRVQQRQAAVGYSGDFTAWLAKVTPPDMQ
ncbi:MAG: FAD-dependent oxidoreductase [Deltaproteobacteria bacterium]|nr:FAD-dependent oxidoreductase [Deltaproteobacteria bacterium]